MTPCAPSADGRQTIGTTSYDVLILEAMTTPTSCPCAPYTIVPTMQGFIGSFLRLNEYAN